MIAQGGSFSTVRTGMLNITKFFLLLQIKVSTIKFAAAGIASASLVSHCSLPIKDEAPLKGAKKHRDESAEN